MSRRVQAKAAGGLDSVAAAAAQQARRAAENNSQDDRLDASGSSGSCTSGAAVNVSDRAVSSDMSEAYNSLFTLLCG